MKSNVSIISFLLVGLPLLAQQSAYTVAFQPIPTRQQPLSSRGSRLSSPNAIISERRLHSRIILASANNSGSDGVGDDVANLRNEIAKMKREAMEKLNILEKATSGSTSVSNLRTDTGSTRNDSSTRNKMDVSMEIVRDEENEAMSNGLLTRSSNDEFIENQNERRKKSTVAASNKVNVQGIQLNNASRSREELSLLCDTTWKVSFSIGREPGTWMPKDWGVSGERLILNLEMTFTNEQLYEREEFLGSMGGANILKVKNNELTLAPTINAGERKIKVVNGGWRVAQGAGPMGTDLLRFYIETEEQIGRGGSSDVYCPSGRIYCNCGYFPTNRQTSGYKDRLKKQLDSMIYRAEQLDEEIANEGPFSLTRIKKQTELFRLKVDMQQTGERLMAASVAEPNDSILKMSPDGMVGVTKEGGVCCKVNKGISIEYHILGRFNIAPVRRQDY